MEAIAKIGDPEAARLIRTIFPTEPWHVKNYASGAMGKIKLKKCCARKSD